MPASIREVFKNELDRWINQPEVDLQEYELIPLNILWSSVTVSAIDGLLWTQSSPAKQLENVAGRFLYSGQVYKWIVPGHSMAQRAVNAMADGNPMAEGAGIPGGVKIPGGVREHDGLSSALSKIHQNDLKRMGFEIRISAAQCSVAITVQQIARCILYNQVIEYVK